MGRRRYRREVNEARSLAKEGYHGFEEQLQKIGSSIDDSTLSCGYNYKLVRPYYKNKFVIPKKLHHQQGKPKTLKLLASISLARNCLSLTPSHLKVGVWQTWSQVWDLILVNEFDSPYIFNMFAQAFYNNKDFPTHFHLKPQRDDVNLKRNQLILEKTLKKKNHRLETLSWNSRDFPKCLHHTGFENLVILDLSSLRGTSIASSKKFYIELTNLRTLAFLNCNYLCDIDEYVCSSWIMSLKMGKWPVLRLLCLKEAQIGVDGFHRLMSVKDSQLYYIETSIKLPQANKGWTFITLSDLIKNDTSLKYHYIERNLKPSFLGPDGRHLIMDFKVIDNEIKLSINDLQNHAKMNHLSERIWAKRSERRATQAKQYSYVLKEKIRDDQANDTLESKPRYKKPKLTSHRKFFDL